MQDSIVELRAAADALAGLSVPNSYAELPELMTVKDAARYLRMSRSRVYSLMDTGQLAFVRIGDLRRIERSEVLRLVEESRLWD
jgi:excisionase family DNA binding protein